MIDSYKIKLQILDDNDKVIGTSEILSYTELKNNHYDVSVLHTLLFKTLREMEEKKEERVSNPHHHTNRID